MKITPYIIIPVFNEKTVIGRVLDELHSYGYEHIVVVDDGSTDGTQGAAERSGVAIVLRHRMNRGKGAAVKTGIEAAKRFSADVVVTFDGDNQHDPKDIAILLSKIREGYDVVLGSRFLHRQHVPFWKRLGNTVANIITYAMFGIWVTDSQSGLRAYTRKAFEVIDTESDRYEIESETLREIKRHHLRYAEIPMHVRYTAYSQKKENRQHVWSALVTMARLILSG